MSEYKSLNLPKLSHADTLLNIHVLAAVDYTSLD